jgi:hypothetical protein
MTASRFRVCEDCAARRGLAPGIMAGSWLVGDVRAEEVNAFASQARLCDDCGARVAHYWRLDLPGPFRGGPKGTKADRVSVPLRLTPANVAWLRAQAGQPHGRSQADVVNALLDAARAAS